MDKTPRARLHQALEIHKRADILAGSVDGGMAKGPRRDKQRVSCWRISVAQIEASDLLRFLKGIRSKVSILPMITAHSEPWAQVYTHLEKF